MSRSVTLDEYLEAERTHERHGARIGLLIHGVITALVGAALIAINVIVAPQFPWSPFPVAGMTIGLAFHYFGVRRIDQVLRARQERIKTEAARTAA